MSQGSLHTPAGGISSGPLAASVAERHEGWLAVAFAVLLLLANLLTATGFPVIYDDDVLLSDAGVNLAMGHGFTSTAWPGQDKAEFFSGNLPLYPLVLAGWLSLVGFGHLQMHAFSYLCASGAALLLWWSVRRLQWIRTARWRLAFLVVVFLSAPVALAYRHCRYDAWQILLGTAVLAVLASGWGSRVKALLLFALGVAISLSGLQMALFAGLLGVAALLLRRPGTPLQHCALLAGLGVGAAGIFCLWAHLGTLHGLMANLEWGRRLDGGTPEAIRAARIHRLVGDTLRDVALLGLLAAMALPLSQAGLRKERDVRLRLAWAAFLALTIMLAMEAGVHFPIYYRWMTLLPVAVMAFHSLERTAHRLTPGRRAGARLFLCLVALMGFPGTWAAATLLIPYRSELEELRTLAATHLRPEDVAFSEYHAYTAVKPRVAQVFFPGYYSRLTAAERASLTVLILRIPHQAGWPAADYQTDFVQSGQWVPVAAVSPYRAVTARWLARWFPAFVERREFQSSLYEVTVFRHAP